MDAPDFTPSAESYPFTSRWLDTSQGRVHYIDEGVGQPLLLLHGNPAWSFLYRNVVRTLKGQFRCVAIDYLGFGLSERPEGFGYTPAEHASVVTEVIQRLDLQNLIVMGQDWGGPTGLSAAADNADRVAGLVLGNTSFWDPSRSQRGFSRVMATGFMQRQILQKNLLIERFLFSNVVRPLSDTEKEHYRLVQPTPELRVAVAAAPGQIVHARPWLIDLQKRVKRELGDKPVLVTYPMADRSFPAKVSLPRFRATFNDIRILELPATKHFFLEDASPQVAEAIARRFGTAGTG
ncbi:alpha/beta fold hydrolase [Streptomyces sp. NPDC047046]|uniref:alpha/beta fold hydrolase n=1 Tax=Streptomyces sp. NPDC047046 TaxID=3155378 RepID=UPI0033E341E2